MAGDIVYYPIANNPAQVDIGPGWVNPIIPLSYTDVIHGSHAVGVKIHDIQIVGGQEDVIDMNNDSSDILVENVRVHPNGKFGFTLKGGSKNIILRNVVFETHGSEVDIDLGNWSDQDKVNKTTLVRLENVTSVDGKPVRVRVLFASNPEVIGGNVKVTVYPSWLVSIIRFFQRHF